MLKRCGKCGSTKSISDFHKAYARADGHLSICKSCQNGHNALQRIFFGLVGGRKRYLELSKPQRKAVRESASVIQEARLDASAVYAAADEKWNAKHPGGFVYIITNPAFPGWVKIGLTTDPERRLSNYQTASPYRDYEMVEVVKVNDRASAEITIHGDLGGKSERKGEWFRTTVDAARAHLQFSY